MLRILIVDVDCMLLLCACWCFLLLLLCGVVGLARCAFVVVLVYCCCVRVGFVVVVRCWCRVSSLTLLRLVLRLLVVVFVWFVTCVIGDVVIGWSLAFVE